MKRFFSVLACALMLTACAKTPGQNQYNYKEVGQSVIVDFAAVVAVREVDIEGRNTGAGATAGALAGGGAGAYAGDGSGQAWAIAGGAIAGAVVGHVAEQEMANKKGYEYTVVTEHKDTKTIVQYQNPDDVVFKVGDRVMVQTRGIYQRVLPTDNLPETIKRPKGIKIVD